jgi:hypothetical protein
VTASSESAWTRARRSTRFWVPPLIVAVVGVALVAVVIEYPGWSRVDAFSGQLVLGDGCSGCSEYQYAANFTNGTQVRLHWADESGLSVVFVTITPDGWHSFYHKFVPSCYFQPATNGSCSFVSTGGVYTF